MPYKSEAQRRFFHYAEHQGKIAPNVVNEFDNASKGQKLPDRVKFPKIKQKVSKKGNQNG